MSSDAPLKVHHLKPAPGAHTKKTRVGRGEGSKGKTAGRGTKGTKARYQVPAGREGGNLPLHMRLPKLKGFRNPFRVEAQVVNVATLAALFPDGGEVTPETLVSRGAVRAGAPVKVVFPGKVLYAAPFQGYGDTVIVQHPGRVFTLYAGLSAMRVGKEDMLSLGDTVGLASDRLYFEIRVENRPEDPLSWIR